MRNSVISIYDDQLFSRMNKEKTEKISKERLKVMLKEIISDPKTLTAYEEVRESLSSELAKVETEL